MPAFLVPIIASIGATVGGLTGAFLIMNAAVIASAIVVGGMLAYSNMKQIQARQRGRDAFNAAQVDRLINVSSTTAPRELVMGRVRKGGAVFYKASTGTFQKEMYVAIALAGHEIDAVEAIYLNDVLVTLDGSGYVTTEPYATLTTITATATAGGPYLGTPIAGSILMIYDSYGEGGTYSGNDSYQYTVSGSNVQIFTHLGQAGQAADAALLAAFPADWLAANTVQGCAYLVAKLTYSETSFPSGVPNITAVIRGEKLYDPRTGTTVWSENPALMMRHVYQHSNFGKSAVTAAEDARFIVAANSCDLATNYGAGSTQLYKASIVVPYGVQPRSALDDLAQSMGGSWAFAGGEFYLRAGVYTAPVMALTDADMATEQRDGTAVAQKPIGISVHQQQASKFNTVKAQIWDQAQDYKQVALTPLVGAALLTRDGVTLTQEVTFPAIGRSAQALHVAGIMMRDARDPMVIELPVKLSAYPLELFDCFTLTLPRYGFVAKQFVLLARSFAPDGTLTLTAKETTAAITQMDAGFAAQGFAVNTNLPSPWIVEKVGMMTVASELLSQADGTMVSRLKISWPAMTDVAVRQGGRIEVQYRPANSTTEWTSLFAQGDDTQVVTSEVQDRAYYLIRARAKTTLAVSDWNLQVQYQVLGQKVAPEAATALTTSTGMFQISLAWVLAASVRSDLRNTEVWGSTTNTIGSALRLSSVPWPETNFVHVGLQSGQTWYYWVRITDTSGNTSTYFPSTTAGVSGVTNSDPSALLAQLQGSVGLAQLGTSLAATIDLVDGGGVVPVLPYSLVQMTADQTALNQKITRDLSDVGVSLLDTVITVDDTNTKVFDAGLYVDPATGLVKITTLEQTKERLSTAEVTISAQTASINLKASVTYVDNKIAEAVLDPSQVTGFTTLEQRVTTAEGKITASEGEILLRTTTAVSDPLGVRLTSAEGSITSLDGSIADKISSATYTADQAAVNERLGTAETSLSALGDTSAITQIVSQSKVRYTNDALSAEALLRSILTGNAESQAVQEGFANARTDLTAQFTDGFVAEASARLELAGMVGQNAAAIVDEKNLRASADSAEASARTALASRVTTAEGSISTNASAISNTYTKAQADSSVSGASALIAAAYVAADVINLSTSKIYADAAVLVETTARASAGYASASSVSTVQARLDEGDFAAVKAESSTTATKMGTVEAKWGVQVQTMADGKRALAGLSLLAGPDAESVVGILADKLVVYKPDGTGAPKQILTLGTVGGVTALGLNGNLIIEKSITAASAAIDDLAVDTLQIAGYAVTRPVSAYTDAYVSYTGLSQVIQTVSITTTGMPVFIVCAYSAYMGAAGFTTKHYIYRDGVALPSAQAFWATGGAIASDLGVSFVITDTPTAGAHTYEIRAELPGGSQFGHRSLFVMETKK